MTVKQFITANSDSDLDLIHVPNDVNLEGVEVEKFLRTGKGFVHPDSIYFEPDTGNFVELITLDN